MSQYDFALGSSSRPSPKAAGRKPRWSAAPDTRPTCLEGFEHGPQAAVRKKFFAPPVLPRDFKPVHVARKSRFEPEAEPREDDGNTARRRGLERHALTAEDRSHIIGKYLVAVPKSLQESNFLVYFARNL